jgi:hypothetical protein
LKAYLLSNNRMLCHINCSGPISEMLPEMRNL